MISHCVVILFCIYLIIFYSNQSSSTSYKKTATTKTAQICMILLIALAHHKVITIICKSRLGCMYNTDKYNCNVIKVTNLHIFTLKLYYINQMYIMNTKPREPFYLSTSMYIYVVVRKHTHSISISILNIFCLFTISFQFLYRSHLVGT